MTGRHRTGALFVAVACGVALAPALAAHAAPVAKTDQARADAAIAAHTEDVRGSAGDQFTLARVIHDADGRTHVRYTRDYRGLPVVGGDIVVHLAPDGTYTGSSVSMRQAITVSTTPRLSAAQAEKSIVARKGAVAGIPRLVVDATSVEPRLAWRMTTSTGGARATALVDAATGAVRQSVPDEQTAAGTGSSMYSGNVPLDTMPFFGSYAMVDPVRGNATTCDLGHAWSGPCPVFIDSDNAWGTGSPTNNQTAAVDVHYGTANAYDYYKNVLGRNGVFGDGKGVASRVHRGPGWVNAHWSSSEMLMEYGDGAGDLKPLTSLDVTAHELTHGVTQVSVPGGLIYANESGGLNESTSDIFGTMAEFYASNSHDPGDYLIGEKVDINGDGTPLRYMYKPSLDGASADCWSPSVATMDPHYSSGVGNHFYFLLAQGSNVSPYGTSPTCDGSSVVGIGRSAAAKIWYHALDAYFTSGETYADAQVDSLAAAADLYGVCSSRWFAVGAAWRAVGVGFGAPVARCLAWKYLAIACICIWPCPDPGPLRWLVDVREWGTLNTIEVGVDISHERRGDLQIDLVAPTGQSYRLKSADRRDVAPDVNEVFQVRLEQGTVQPGAWALVVTDTVRGARGQINGWTMLY